MKKSIENVQKALKTKHFQAALEGAQALQAMLKNDVEHVDFYLTSLVWEIRARQGLKHPCDEIERAALRYEQESSRLNCPKRVVQALRIRAQMHIDAAQWSQASDCLQDALAHALSAQCARESLEILMHLSAIELKMCHYVDAIEALSHATQCLPNAGLPDQDARAIEVAANRQLAELYDTIGEGSSASQALEKARKANHNDLEESWLIDIMTARRDLRMGYADDAVKSLKKIVQQIKKAIPQEKARPEQLAMAQLEYAQALWAYGDFKKAIDLTKSIDAPKEQRATQLALALTQAQWAAELGIPLDDPDAKGLAFAELCNQSEDTSVQILLAAALTQASLQIERGNFETTLQSLLHIAQTAAFTQLIPFATRALILRALIQLAQNNYEDAAEDAHDACETFIAHSDYLAASQAGALMILAQFLRSEQHGKNKLAPQEQQAFQQLLLNLNMYEQHHALCGWVDLALILAKIAHKAHMPQIAKDLLDRLEARLTPMFGAQRSMLFALRCAEIRGDQNAKQRANEIALQNQFFAAL